MLKKSLITSILTFLVLGMVSSSCSVSLFRTKETKEKEKEEKSQFHRDATHRIHELRSLTTYRA